MSAEFYADVVETGTILGLDHNMGPDAATAILGPGEDIDAYGTFRRSYSHIEIAWAHRRSAPGWSGLYFQVNPFVDNVERDLGKAVFAKYGKFRGPLMFDALRQELDNRGVELVEVESIEPDAQLFWQPQSQMKVEVSADPNRNPGTVSTIISDFRFDPTLILGQHDVIWPQMNELVGEAAREQWVERNRPGDFTAWWRTSCRIVHYRLISKETPSEFVALLDWMWTYGVEQKAFDARYAALERARFATDVDEERPDLVKPEHDALVADCLSHVSPAMNRDDKNLIDAAFQLRHGLSDTRQLDETHTRRMSTVT